VPQQTISNPQGSTTRQAGKNKEVCTMNDNKLSKAVIEHCEEILKEIGWTPSRHSDLIAHILASQFLCTLPRHEADRIREYMNTANKRQSK
jgi:hypothetical protein